MVINGGELLRKYRNMRPSKFVEHVYGIKLFAYQKVLVDVFADRKKFYFPIYGRARLK